MKNTVGTPVAGEASPSADTQKNRAMTAKKRAPLEGGEVEQRGYNPYDTCVGSAPSGRLDIWRSKPKRA
jgi:hypothetical protein